MNDESRTERLLAMLANACLGKDADVAFETDLEGFLASHDVAREDIDALLASPRRLGLYRRLVRHNVTAVIDTMLERTRARLEARVPGKFDDAVAAFLDELGPRTPHMRDVPSEFLAYAAPRWRADDRLPKWIADYAELELLDFTIGVAPRPLPPPPLAEVTADRPLVFAEPKQLISLAWAVNELPDDVLREPAERPVSILVYRDKEHRSRFLELTPLAAAILDRLFAGDALGTAMVAACQAKGHPLDDSVLAGAARLLADLGERGVLLGARES
ncbi:MAG TPA: putative DNA-binding domain-containing protein [Labilithrix sp.]|nr:putative DNA-binding domain-containing protein [Labilithrix sp.]